MAQLLDADRVQGEAEAAAGIADPERSLYFDNLRRLVDSLNEEGRLTIAGAAAAHEEFVGALRNRLESIRWIRDCPEIANERIEAPLFLTGLPRSGTTYFQNLFNVDPALRLLQTWESRRPCPPPFFDRASVETRLAAAEAEVEHRGTIMPGFDALHLNDADGPDECHALLTQSFGAAGFHNIMNVPSYWDWMASGMDMDAVYANHRRQLQILQWRGPRRRWTLKYPNHLIAMDVIVRLHPDARFLVTHRDPRQTLASICKLSWSFSRARTDGRDKVTVGRQMRSFIRRHIDGLMRFHASPDAARAVHVDYYRVAQAPAAVLAEAYAALGMTMAPEVAEAVAAWHRANPKNKRGANDYALTEYGLDPDEIAEFCGDYIAAFAIPSEADGVAGVQA